MKKKMVMMMVMGMVVLLMLAGCGGNQPTQNVEDNNQPEVVADDPTPEGHANQPDEETDQPTEPVEEPVGTLPVERQPVEITTGDGRTLEGYYYPGSTAGASIIVLMHWAPGSMADWETIALWLQNRSVGAVAATESRDAFHDPSWFPQMPAEVSFAVMIFNFGNYGNSQYGGSRQSLVLDAQAALEHAASFPDVDPHGVAAIGASIGADGVVDACYLFNDAGEKGTCLGALSLSPGNYLTDEFTYPFAADMINLSGYPVWCLAAENDGSSPDLCLEVQNEMNRAFIFSGRHHGMELVDAEMLPTSPEAGMNTLELVQEFLEQVYGITLNDLDLP